MPRIDVARTSSPRAGTRRSPAPPRPLPCCCLATPPGPVGQRAAGPQPLSLPEQLRVTRPWPHSRKCLCTGPRAGGAAPRRHGHATARGDAAAAAAAARRQRPRAGGGAGRGRRAGWRAAPGGARGRGRRRSAAAVAVGVAAPVPGGDDAVVGKPPGLAGQRRQPHGRQPAQGAGREQRQLQAVDQVSPQWVAWEGGVRRALGRTLLSWRPNAAGATLPRAALLAAAPHLARHPFGDETRRSQSRAPTSRCLA
jgi:hypothetical protein